MAAGLYDPRFGHDACGVGLVEDLSERGGHGVAASALRVLCHLAVRLAGRACAELRVPRRRRAVP